MAECYYTELFDTGLRALTQVGVPQKQAEIQMALLLDAECRGTVSHGVLRLPRIIERINNGVTSPTTQGKIDWFASAMGRVDGQQGLGPVVAMHAITEALERAKTSGVCAVAIRHCDHLGMLAFYAEHIAKSGMVGLGLTLSEALVHPWGGLPSHARY